MDIRVRNIAFSVALGLFAASGASAEPVQQHNTAALWFENWGDLSNAVLKVATPSGKLVSVEASSGTPVFQLNAAEAMDGIYRYELSAATSEQEETVNQVDNGRGDAASNTIAKPYYKTGTFYVSRGVIVTPELQSEDGD